MGESLHPKPNTQRGLVTLYQLRQGLLLLVTVAMLSTCNRSDSPPMPATPPLAKTLILYNWAGYMPPSLLAAFTQAYGVKVDYQTYGSQKEAVDSLRAGKVYDVAIIDNDRIPALVVDGLLAKLDMRHIPNFKNISANFRDLAYDPGNQHAVPFNWGTTGLLVRKDLIQQPVTRWADLWDARYAGKVAVWALQRPLIDIALRTLGRPVNSEKPSDLEAALQRLLELKANVIFIDLNAPSVTPMLVSGQAVIAYGWAYDALTSRAKNKAIDYILPAEGTLLWGDNLVIPANSPNKDTAELFLNFLLRPESGAQLVNELYYANANEAARPWIKPKLLQDPLIFPPEAVLKNAEIMMPPSPAGKKLYDQIWERFMTAVKPDNK